MSKAKPTKAPTKEEAPTPTTEPREPTREELIAAADSGEPSTLSYPVTYERKGPSTSSTKEEPEDTTTEEAEQMEEGEEDAAEASEGFIPPGLDAESYTNLQSEIEETGTLSAEAYTYLAGKGYPKDFVDRYIAQGLAANAAAEQAVYASVGGQEAWDTDIAPWARANLTTEQKAAFDESITSKDHAKISDAMAEVKKLKEEATGKPPALRLEGKKASVSGGLRPFASPGDYQRAIGDSRWLKDAEYTANVRARWALNRKQGDRLL